MPEIFSADPDDDAFSVPGDETTLARMRQAAGAEEPPPPAEPAEPAAVTEPAGPAAQPAAATETPAAEPAVGGELDADDPRVQQYLAKFDGDIDKALAAAAEAQSVIGRQGQELGELRQLVEQRLGAVEERQAAAVQPQYDQAALEGWFSDNPTKIPEVAAQAFYQGDQYLLDQAIAAWEEIDKPGARRFERQVAVAEARREIHAESAQAQQDVSSWNTAARAFAEAHPDLEQVAPRMHELAPNYPNIVSVLQSGDANSKLEVLEFLYEKATRGQQADTLAAARTIAREQAHEAEEAIKGAAVASAATVVAAQPAPLADRIAAEWDKADAPYSDGWNV